ncbi:MAG: tetratricopeptide repeat protein [Thermoguttaceae bacterium]
MLLLVGFARADTLADFQRLSQQFARQFDAGEYQQAEQTALALRGLAEGPLRRAPVALGRALGMQARVVARQGRHEDAERLYQQAIAVLDSSGERGQSDLGIVLNGLGELYRQIARYGQAEPAYRRALEVWEKQLGPAHQNVAAAVYNLAAVNHAMGRYAEAEPLARRALEIDIKLHGPEHFDVASCLSLIGTLYHEQGRDDEAEPMYQRALAIQEKALGPQHPHVADTLHNLVLVSQDRGRYAEAELLARQALEIRRRSLPADHPDVADSLHLLAGLLNRQGRHDEAVPLCRDALVIRMRRYGRDHGDVADSLAEMANLYDSQGRHAEEEDFLNQALEIRRKVFGEDHPKVAASLGSLALMYEALGRPAEAERACREALDIRERRLGRDHPDVANTLHNLASLLAGSGRYEEAEELLDRAMQIEEKSAARPEVRCRSHFLKADLAWRTGRKEAAVELLERAMDFAEEQRVYGSGSEWQRAQLFAKMTDVFERMVAWQSELGGAAEAFSAIERSRARSLLDQMATQGVDLLAGLPKAQAVELRQSEQEAQRQVATWEKQIRLLADRRDLASDQRDRELESLAVRLVQARREYVAAYSDLRNASPACRLSRGERIGPTSLDALSSWVAERNALWLEYLLGAEGAYVVVVPSQGSARIERLSIGENQAGALGVDAGPLTAGRLGRALANEEGTGVLGQVSTAGDAERARLAAPGLAALWEVLVPAAEREALTRGKIEHLVVVPDGPLALLPLETLVVAAGGGEPRYLLDAGPPITYAPSATILRNLEDRKPDSTGTARLLSVGDPQYEASPPGETGGAQARQSTAADYTRLGGRLARLPYTGWETEWVAGVVGEQGFAVDRLTRSEATESRVRAAMPSHWIIHMACHGLADQAYGNLFGALALCPGRAPADPADDGFLTLPEIYALDLRGAELAVLSACRTNFGPQQRGEGIWALSRGFLVAGARRVVASNWLVDDEAAASLVSYYLALVARDQKQHGRADYSAALHQAKRWVRANEKWKTPYYWSMFVLVGTP